MMWTLEQNENLLKAFGNFPSTCICNQIYHGFQQEPLAAFHTKGQFHVHFLGTSRRNYQSCRHKFFFWCKKQQQQQQAFYLSILSLVNPSALQKLFCYWQLLEKLNVLEHLHPWRLVCWEERQKRDFRPFTASVAPQAPLCLAYIHSLSLKYKHYKILKIWGLQAPQIIYLHFYFPL